MDVRGMVIAATRQPHGPRSADPPCRIAVAQQGMRGIRRGQGRPVFLQRRHQRSVQRRQFGFRPVEQPPARLRAAAQRLAERQGRGIMQAMQQRAHRRQHAVAAGQRQQAGQARLAVQPRRAIVRGQPPEDAAQRPDLDRPGQIACRAVEQRASLIVRPQPDAMARFVKEAMRRLLLQRGEDRFRPRIIAQRPGVDGFQQGERLVTRKARAGLRRDRHRRACVVEPGEHFGMGKGNGRIARPPPLRIGIGRGEIRFSRRQPQLRKEAQRLQPVRRLRGKLFGDLARTHRLARDVERLRQAEPQVGLPPVRRQRAFKPRDCIALAALHRHPRPSVQRAGIARFQRQRPVVPFLRRGEIARRPFRRRPGGAIAPVVHPCRAQRLQHRHRLPVPVEPGESDGMIDRIFNRLRLGRDGAGEQIRRLRNRTCLHRQIARTVGQRGIAGMIGQPALHDRARARHIAALRRSGRRCADRVGAHRSRSQPLMA